MKKEDSEEKLEIDESLLTPEQLEEMHKKRSYTGWIIFFSITLALVIGLVVAIFLLGGPVQ